MTRLIYLLVAVLVALAGLAFHIRNKQDIDINNFNIFKW